MPSKSIFLIDRDLPSADARIVKIDISRFEVEGYDVDNGYPQRMETLVEASPTAKMAVNLYADFIFGQGFSVSDGKTKYGKDSEDGVWNMVVNSKGQTGDDLLSLAAADYANWNKFFFQVNYNALFNGVEINYVPYGTARYGIDSKAGTIALYDNWWNNDRFGRLNISKDKPDYIDLFNPDADAIKAQVRNAGGWSSYKGQIFEFSTSYKNYPLHNLDAGINAMRAEILSYKTTYGNIKNNFGDKVIWIEKGKFENESEREAFKRSIQGFVGPDGEQVIVAEVEQEDQAPKMETIENKLDDKKFAYSNTHVRSTLYRLLGQNAILHSDLTEGRYNQNQLSEAIKAYNNRTERARINMQRAFKKLFSVIGVEADCAITPLNDLNSASENNQGANTNGSTDTNLLSN